jgi:type IV secretion system protein VirB5
MKGERIVRNLKVQIAGACLVACFAAAPAAQAQWAVVDAPAIVQLIQEVQTMAQQLATARQQLSQAQQALQTMTGDRGMAQLLNGTVRNYLPANWAQVTGALQAGGSFPALSGDVQNLMTTNAVLSPQRLATLSPAAQQLVMANRQWAAMQQALTREAFANASSRFTALQSLVASIPSATDQKGILDLQARISAELGMLQNEQIKMQMLTQSTQAQQFSLNQQASEQALNGQGRFETRFQPAP